MSTSPPTDLYGVPGLSPARLSEFWRGVLHATQDVNALCEFTRFAKGGLRIDITWKQGGKRHNYPATLTKAELEMAGMDRDDEKVLLGFIAATLDAVRKIRNRNAGIAEELEAPSAQLQPTGVENAVAMMVGETRARQQRIAAIERQTGGTYDDRTGTVIPSTPPATAPPEEKTDGT